MNVLTKSQMSKLNANGSVQMTAQALHAAGAINDLADHWGSMSQQNAESIANQLRKLADMVDGKKTASESNMVFSQYCN